MGEENTDVSTETASLGTAEPTAVSAPADNSPEATQPDASQAITPEGQSDRQAEAAFKVPENDDDLKGRENDPQVVPIIQLRRELRERDQRLDGYKPLDAWKETATTIGDPQIALSAHQLISAIHTPAPDSPSGYTSLPFLQQMETQSPGSVDQIFADTLGVQVPDLETGEPSTVVRNLFKSYGLNPDRVEDYRNIDTLRASGVVSAEDISQIPEKYHAAFKSLSQTVREDLLAMRESNPAAMEEYLRNAQDALEARQWRERDEQARQKAAEQQEAQWREEVQQTIYTDLETESKSMGDSIYQNLSSQFKFSADDGVDELEKVKILSVIGNLQSPIPFYREMATRALKQAGVEPAGFAEALNRWEERRIAYTQYKAMGDQLQAQRAGSEANLARQQILAKANDYVLRVAAKTGERAATQATAAKTQLAAASARFVPSGNGNVQQGTTNPYAQNPHPVGSQEYYAFNRQVDREYNLTNASAYGN
jgi:hypothetical protein